jgi:transcriptional regulator with XRE-family HTH domain
MSDSDFETQDWYSAEAATFGDRMAGAREAVGLSQKGLAKRMGVKLKTVKTWEDDLAEPRANRLQMLAGMLGVSLMWLLTGEGEGIAAPDDRAPMDSECRQILQEVRELKAQARASVDRLARLEKALTRALAGGGA